MATVTFAMGSNAAYFFNTPTHWARKNLPPDVESLFTKQPEIKEVFELAIGEKGAYFVSFRDADGLIYCRHFNLPNPLSSWLYNSQPQIVRDLTKLYITLGQYEAYYASDGASSSWANLPPTLEKALESRRTEHSPWKPGEEPTFVSLGAEGRYFMRTANGGGGWELKGKAEGINKYLIDAPNFSDVAGLWLFPSHPESYIMTTMEGKAFSNLPEHTWADYTKMVHSIPDLRPKPQMQPTPMMAPQQMSPQPILYAQPSQYAPQPMVPQPVSYAQSFQSQTQTLVPQAISPQATGIFYAPQAQQPQPMMPQPTGVAYGTQPLQRAMSTPQTPLTPLTPMTPPPQYAASPFQQPSPFFPPQQQQFVQPQQPQFAQPQPQYAPQQPQQQFAQPLQQPQQPFVSPVQSPAQPNPAAPNNSRAPQALLGIAAGTAVGAVMLGKFLKAGKGHHGGHGGGHVGGGGQEQYGGDPSQYGGDPSQYANPGYVDPGLVDPTQGQGEVLIVDDPTGGSSDFWAAFSEQSAGDCSDLI